MLRIRLIAIGRMKAGPERELAARYLDRAEATGRPLGLSDFSVTEIAESRAAGAEARKAEEARAIRAALSPAETLVALDERGKSLTSLAFSERIGRWRDTGLARLSFVIGGADGLDPGLVDEAELALSLSALTWPHQLVRVMLAEQLYRATAILAGHPYHRE